MRLIHALWVTVRTLAGRRRAEADMDEELRLHLEREIDERIARGTSPEEARRQASQAFGSIVQTKEACRDSLGVTLMDSLAQDLRLGARMLRRQPGFTLAVTLAMALGIGANTAIFSVVHGVALKPLPYDQQGRVLFLGALLPRDGAGPQPFAALELQDHRDRTRTLDHIVEYHQMWFILYARGEPARLRTGVVSADFFEALGITPHLGRLFRPDDNRHGAPGVLVLSHAYWREAFGGDPSVIGTPVTMNDRAHTIVGVLPPVPIYPDENDIFMPVMHCPFHAPPVVSESRTMRMKLAFGRMRPAVTLDQAQADLDRVAGSLQKEHPEAYPTGSGYRVAATPITGALVQDFHPTLLALIATSALVLLIVCASVANLMLARLLRREREMAVRTAIGAGRGRLIRQLTVESLLLTGIGAALGLGVAAAALELLRTLTARFTPRAQEIALDLPVLAFTVGLAVATGLLFGALPSWPAARQILPSLSGTGGGGTASTNRVRLRNALIVGQVAVSMTLLVCAGLLVRSFVNLLRVDPGFRTEQVVTWQVPMNFTKYDTAARRASYHRAFLETLAATPGVLSVGASGAVPLGGIDGMTSQLRFRHRDQAPDAPAPRAGTQVTSPGYFTTMDIPLLAGRPFTDSDDAASAPVVIVSQSLARRYWGRENPLGQAMAFDGGPTWFTIVGIVGDVRQRLDSDLAEQVYFPLFRFPGTQMTFAARSTLPHADVIARVRDAARAVDADQPVDTFQSVEELRRGALAPPRLTAMLLTLFAALAVTVTAIGLAGVVGFSVSQRLREFGVRLALGAERRDLFALVVRQGLWLVGFGLIVGLAGALLLARQMVSLLYGIGPADWPTTAAAALLLLVIGVGACVLPARRAANVDPLIALRSQ